MKPVGERIQTIQNIFRDVQDSFPETYSHAELGEKLNSYEAEYRSIAYEAASFCIALKDLEAGNNLRNWNFFLAEIGIPHATQIHVGLGWALAQHQITSLDFFNELQPMMRYRLLDGYGYYEGIFRKRKSILSQQQLDISDTVALSAYDQGLGRSLWYLNTAQIESVKMMLEKFPAERRSDLWRGVGIACSYVGGLNEDMLKQIFQCSEEYKSQLIAGAVMTTISRNTAGSINADTTLVCRIWCNRSVEELAANYNNYYSVADKESADFYRLWISKIESDFK